jgi:hypothetical protein
MTPERCGQRHTTLRENLPSVEYTCDLAAGHRSEFHLDTGQLATWSRAGDLVHHATTAQADARCRPSHFAERPAVEVVASGRINMAERFARVESPPVPGREHIVKVGARDVDRMREWLERPNGALTGARYTLEAVEDGGILIRTMPYGSDR